MSCPVCFNAGMADETVRTSINLGIGVMLTVTAVVLAGFLRFIASIIRRSTGADVPAFAPALRRVRRSLGGGGKVGPYDRADVRAGLQTGPGF